MIISSPNFKIVGSQQTNDQLDKKKLTMNPELLALVKGCLARSAFRDRKYQTMINSYKVTSTKLLKHVTQVGAKVEENWKNNLINQDLEKKMLGHLQILGESALEFRECLAEANLKPSSHAIIEHYRHEYNTLLKGHYRVLRSICEECGFKGLKSGLEILFGTHWKRMFGSGAIDVIEQIHRIFFPLGFHICSVEDVEEHPICSIVQITGTRAFPEESKKMIHQIPFFTKYRFFEPKVLFEKIHGGELAIPFKNYEGKYNVLIMKGVFSKDPIGVEKKIPLLQEKVKSLNETLDQIPLISKQMKEAFITQYPLRDLCIKTNLEISKEVEEDFEYIQTVKNKITPAELMKFIATNLERQVKQLSLMLLKNEPNLAMVLYEVTLKSNPEYQQMLRSTIHFSLQRKLNLAFEQMDDVLNKFKQLKVEDVSYDSQIAMSKMSDDVKAKALDKLKQIKAKGGDGDKAEKYLNGLLKIPFGIFSKDYITNQSSPTEIQYYLQHVRKILDDSVWGHEKSKKAVMEWVAQRISNQQSKGECIALEGPPGTGKTTFAKEGIAKALGRPFAFISMGGMADSSFLIGHGYTYIGSDWGRIVQILIEKRCMDPIIYIDEVDKMSDTAHGRELIGVLTALTDFSQNKEFHDKYFSGVDFDLSRALFIFSYNDPQKLDPVLKDRLQVIKVAALSLSEKIQVVHRHLMPEILKSTGFTEDQIKISNEVIKFIVENYTNEAGARKLRENLFAIVRQLNLLRLQEPGSVSFPFEITRETVIKFRDGPKFEHKKIAAQQAVGMVNGLFATTSGVGGLTIIQAFKTIGKERLELTLTGSQGKVMKESMSVARSVAWNLIPQDVRDKIQQTAPEGLHIHAPDGAMPKDGPSAGGAITCAILSRLLEIPVKNSVAMTGEIDLTGRISKIGGLDAKLQGAKRAGVSLALIPKDNQADFENLKIKHPELIDEAFKVVLVESIHDILDYAFASNPILRTTCIPVLTNRVSPPSDRLHCCEDDGND
jgi:endopeptidase La